MSWSWTRRRQGELNGELHLHLQPYKKRSQGSKHWSLRCSSKKDGNLGRRYGRGSLESRHCRVAGIFIEIRSVTDTYRTFAAMVSTAYLDARDRDAPRFVSKCFTGESILSQYTHVQTCRVRFLH